MEIDVFFSFFIHGSKFVPVLLKHPACTSQYLSIYSYIVFLCAQNSTLGKTLQNK